LLTAHPQAPAFLVRAGACGWAVNVNAGSTAMIILLAENHRSHSEHPMAASKLLVERIRHVLSRHRGITEKKMFGGVCFLLNGNMLVAVWNDSLIARLGIEQAEIALTEPDVREMDLTGRPMRGWIIVEPDGIDSDRQLTHWVDLSMTFVRTLPAK